MSNTVQVGKILNTDHYRDAIHVAIAPVTAAVDLKPGQHIRFVNKGDTENVGSCNALDIDAFGIVDPYLTKTVKKGHRFFAFLYPNPVTSLRHCWTHPAFKDEGKVDERKVASLAWFRSHEHEYGFDTDNLIAAVLRGEGYCFNDDAGPDFARSSEFWHHMMIITGKDFDVDTENDKYQFRCAC